MSVNYREIIDNLDSEKVIKLMTMLGAKDYKETENYIIFPTLCHNVDIDNASFKLYYYKNSHYFHCYTNCEHLSIFNLLEEYYQTREIDYNWYNDVFLVAQNCAELVDFNSFIKPAEERLRDRYNRRQEIELPEFPKNILNVFSKVPITQWENEGISEAAISKYNILYSISRDKIIIPHYDINGRLVGIRGRALDKYEIEDFGKYMPVKIEDIWYSHSLSFNLYGLNFNKENIKKTGRVFLFESEKSVLQFESFEMPNCAVAVCGSNFNKYQLNLLLKYCYPQEIIICFDKEEIRGEEKYFNKLWKIGKKYSEYCDFSFIYDRNSLLNMKDSPSDRGEEVFRKLFEKRVKVK